MRPHILKGMVRVQVRLFETAQKCEAKNLTILLQQIETDNWVVFKKYKLSPPKAAIKTCWGSVGNDFLGFGNEPVVWIPE